MFRRRGVRNGYWGDTSLSRDAGPHSNLLAFLQDPSGGSVPVRRLDKTGCAWLDEQLAALPELQFALKSTILPLLNAPLDAAFEPANTEYNAYLEHMLHAQEAYNMGNEALESLHLQSDSKLPDRERIARVQVALAAVKERLRVVQQTRLANAYPAGDDARRVLRPRFVRLLERMEITNAKEVEAFAYLLMSQSGAIFASYQETRALMLFCGMTLEGLQAFVNPKRKHMTDGVLEGVQEAQWMNSQLNMSQECVMVLAGAKISDESFLKIEASALADILREEPGSKFTRGEVKAVVDESKLKAQFAKYEGADLYELLRLQREEEARHRAEAGAGGATASTGTGEDGVQAAIDAAKAAGGEGAEGSADAAAGTAAEGGEEGGAAAAATTSTSAAAGDDASSSTDADKMTAYTTDLEYLEDMFKWLSTRIGANQTDLNLKRMKIGHNGYPTYVDPMQEKTLRELQGKERLLNSKVQRRLQLTYESGVWIPRLERLARARNLDETEKCILLCVIGGVLSDDIQIAQFGGMEGNFLISQLVMNFTKTLKEQITFRRYFYKTGTLIKEGILRIAGGVGDELLHATVNVDRRMLDFCVGLDSEFDELVDGSHLYFPKVNLEQVVLPDEQKRLILDTVSSFAEFKRSRKIFGFDDLMTYGTGVCLLFYGASGCGKTMMANSVANHLGKKVLLINFPSLGLNNAGEVIKFIFREAKINDAIVFFDECESIFESREKGSHHVNMLLTELERHDGLSILATNRAFDLDEAMHRRITLAVEFKAPDSLLRQKIWKAHLPPALKLADDLDLRRLAMKYELTGGFIKNAVLSALSRAVSRSPTDVIITQEDLEHGARLQLRGRLRMADFYRRVLPTAGLDALVLREDLLRAVQDIVAYEKARHVMFSQWGFDERSGRDQGVTALFYGRSGTGKTLAAEAIGYELGKPLKIVNCAELLSKWVGETSKNIQAVFEEARSTDSILVFDEAEGLFGQRTSAATSTDRYANIDVGMLLYEMERHPGVVLLTTNQKEFIDRAFYRRLRFMLDFPLPTVELRLKLWRQTIPAKCPLHSDVDLALLAKNYEFSGGNIKSAIYKAASRSALREDDKRVVSMSDLLNACEEEVRKI